MWIWRAVFFLLVLFLILMLFIKSRARSFKWLLPVVVLYRHISHLIQPSWWNKCAKWYRWVRCHCHCKVPEGAFKADKCWRCWYLYVPFAWAIFFYLLLPVYSYWSLFYWLLYCGGYYLWPPWTRHYSPVRIFFITIRKAVIRIRENPIPRFVGGWLVFMAVFIMDITYTSTTYEFIIAL